MKIRKALPLLMIVVIAGGWYINQPAKGKISKQTELKPIPTIAKIATYQGEYLKFSYENKYRTELIDSGGADILENVHLIGNQGVGSEIVVTLKTETAKRLEELSGVILRQVKSKDYTEETIIWNNIPGKIFTDKEGGAAAFFVKDGRSMTVAITRGTKDELKSLVETITWQK